MEAKKEATSSSSSLATDLLGSKDSSSSSSSALIDSISTPPSKAYTRDNVSYEQPKKDHESTHIRDCLENEEKIQNAKMVDLSAYYDQQVTQPCTLSSSLYYGGQDIYIPRTTKNTPGQYSTKYSNKDGDDGSWWQGGPYY